MERRTFLKQAAVTRRRPGIARQMNPSAKVTTPIARRTLGKTGEQLSIIGFGASWS